ncbi:hypothetical protein O6H91_14G060900 [Diphasiastrum complanatum]|uniref:Uncharacterized protein n=1 Tax=Diphasiastrum complanatum TaxID=34168 RepID=A0ACC2BQ19_DIPCM|nr:hypothetical protein O6H91_14G060900 [Diphasiastrum complanatum]
MATQLELPPGFRFHPTDEELIIHYLSWRAACRPFPIPIIAEIDLYKFDPWDLPQKALFGEKEWYFFSPRDRKYPNGARPNRAAASGYWKATGTDKPIVSDGSGLHKVGLKKALVFYKGRAPRGVKTNWIMHEYRLVGDSNLKVLSAKRKGSLRLDDWVLCRIYRKSKSSAQCRAIAATKMEVEEESCLEDVLASLPDIDIDDSKLSLPRLGFHAIGQPEQDQTTIDNFFTAPDYCFTVPRAAAIHHPHVGAQTGWQRRIDQDSNVKLSTRDVVSMPLQASDWRAGDHPSLKSNEEINLDLLQKSFRKRMQTDCDYNQLELDEVESSCTAASPTSRKQDYMDQQQILNMGSLNSNVPFPLAFDHLPACRQSQPNCTIPKLESECNFPKLSGFYIQSTHS